MAGAAAGDSVGVRTCGAKSATPVDGAMGWRGGGGATGWRSGGMGGGAALATGAGARTGAGGGAGMEGVGAAVGAAAGTGAAGGVGAAPVSSIDWRRASPERDSPPRTMADSTTTSFGPPIMIRCSTLSRRTRTS